MAEVEILDGFVMILGSTPKYNQHIIIKSYTSTMRDTEELGNIEPLTSVHYVVFPYGHVRVVPPVEEEPVDEPEEDEPQDPLDEEPEEPEEA